VSVLLKEKTFKTLAYTAAKEFHGKMGFKESKEISLVGLKINQLRNFPYVCSTNGV